MNDKSLEQVQKYMYINIHIFIYIHLWIIHPKIYMNPNMLISIIANMKHI
jgi:hypothetical protein